jgi:erythromycin esterase
MSLGATTVVSGVVAKPAWASAETPEEPVVSWINRHLVPLPRLDAHGPLDDLRALRHIVGDGQVLGLGESVHGTHEQFTLRHRVARFLVEQMGFRTIAWEENFATGVAIDRYVVGGEGDPRALMADVGTLWRSEAMLDFVRWMREFNRNRRDKVRFLGADLEQLRPLNFDELTRYVGDVAPGRKAELESHLGPIRLRGSGWEHAMWYLQQPEPDKQRLLMHARAVHDLALALPAGPSPIDREYAEQHARTILGFYEFYAVQVLDVRDRFIADTITWWQRRTRHRLVYWAATPHTAASPHLTYSLPPWVPPTRAVLAGSHLRQRYGRGYVSIGTVFHTGEVLGGWENGSPSVFVIPPPRPGMVDHTFGQARCPNYLLDLHASAPRPVQRWLLGPATTRLIASRYHADNDATYAMSIDSLRGGFDAILHVNKTTAARPLS